MVSTFSALFKQRKLLDDLEFKAKTEENNFQCVEIMLFIDIFEIVHRPKQIQDQSAINHFEFKWEFSYLHVPTVYFASLRIF